MGSAGVYVPMLANYILYGNKDASNININITVRLDSGPGPGPALRHSSHVPQLRLKPIRTGYCWQLFN